MRKRFHVLAGIILTAVAASAEVMWTGSSVAYANGTWYNCSGTWGSGGNFDGRDFGVLTELVLGGNVSTWWTDSGSHSTDTAVLLGFNVDGTGDHFVALPWLDYGSNNDRWEQMTGVDVFAYLGAGTEHTVDVWFQATGGGNTVFDSNFSNNYTATFTTVPEPTASVLLGLGAAALALRRRRRGCG
jgi:hypothetical protein